MNNKIKLNKTSSVNSVNKDGMVAVEMQQSTKPLHFLDIKSTVDQREIFENERKSCDKYRLILTINPYCTNVLFNPLTEIIKNEGSDNPIVMIDTKGKKIDGNVYGKATDVTRMDMVRNTEYSRDEIGFEYHPGYDIFNNHTIRNQSFKLVNKLGDNLDKSREVFNTLSDWMRYADGSVVKHGKRIDISTCETNIDTHLYQHEDISSFNDTVDENLREDNGWWGFTNKSCIENKFYTSKIVSGKEVKYWKPMGIEKTINSSKNCEFIDMYPDRTLFSFNPKYNSFKHKPEYNWKLCITYPYENYYAHRLVTNVDGYSNINALKVYSVTKLTGKNGNDILQFKTYTKHGVSKGSYIYIYADDKCSNTTYRVTNVGDLNQDNKEYYFYIEDLKILDELGIEYEDIDNDAINEELSGKDFRLSRCVSGVNSKYYIRKFRKLPNFRYKRTELTEDIANDEESFKEYIYSQKNASRDGITLMDFNNEQYKLAFAKTIYNDDATQVTFTDGIDVEHIKDNLGRPLTNIYVTVIKNNKGYKTWYNGEGDFTNAEFSHCFGKVNTGLEMMYGGYSDSGKYSDVRSITNVGDITSEPLEQNDDEVSYDNDTFYGDLVEFNPMECVEKVLADACFRFNTAQREWKKSDSTWLNGEMIIDEIKTDDYDLNTKESFEMSSDPVTNTTERPEGYYYKAHYPIMIKEFGDLTQDSHYAINVSSSKCVVISGKVYVQITSTLRNSLSANDTVYFFDKVEDKWYKTKVCHVINSINFTVLPANIVNVEDKTKHMFEKVNGVVYTPQLDLMARLNDTANNNLCVLRHNSDIPNYAVRLPNQNKFLWRNVLRAGDTFAENIPDYVFANGYFYVTKTLNFYLKRQDPENKIGLYAANQRPSDVFGNIKKTSNYEYKDETTVTC